MAAVIYNEDDKILVKCPQDHSGEFVIPYGVTEIADRAFEGCTCLTSVEVPNSVTRIGWNAFSGCTKLPSVEIPDGVTKVSISEDPRYSS